MPLFAQADLLLVLILTSCMTQVVEVAPNLDQLPKLLGERPYSLEDEDEGNEVPADDSSIDQMDMEHVPTASESKGCASTSHDSKRPAGCYTTGELLLKVQVGGLKFCWLQLVAHLMSASL